MKKSKFLSFITAVICLMNLAINVSAETSNVIQTNDEEVTIVSADSKPALVVDEGSEILSEKTVIEDGKIIITVISRNSDGLIVTDTLSYSAVVTHSPEGSDTVKREKIIENFGTLTISAKFSWRTEGAFAYVKCNSATFTKSLKENVGYNSDESSTSYTSKEVSIGKANATWKYWLYNTKPGWEWNHVKGTLKITCSDNGTISDSGF